MRSASFSERRRRTTVSRGQSAALARAVEQAHVPFHAFDGVRRILDGAEFADVEGHIAAHLFHGADAFDLLRPAASASPMDRNRILIATGLLSLRKEGEPA